MNISCKIYSFLRAVRGNWRNAIFVMYDKKIPGNKFLLLFC